MITAMSNASPHLLNAPLSSLRGFFRSEHLTCVAVAMCCLTLALSGGGYALELRAGAGLAVWWVVLVGLLFGLIPRDRVPRAALVTGTFLAALAIFATASLIWASDNGRAFAEGVRVSGY